MEKVEVAAVAIAPSELGKTIAEIPKQQHWRKYKIKKSIVVLLNCQKNMFN
jgi:hypothetical protein